MSNQTKADETLERAFDLLEDIQHFKESEDFHFLSDAMERVVTELHKLKTKEFDHEED